MPSQQAGSGSCRNPSSILRKPRKHQAWGYSGNIKEPVRIHDPQTTIMEFHDPLLPQASQYAIHVHARETGRVTDKLLRDRQVHLFRMVAGPLHPTSDEQFEKQVRDALARRPLADA